MHSDSMVSKIYEQTGMEQLSLAFYTGAKQSTLSRYEDGKRRLPTDALLKMAALYKIVQQLPPADTPKPSKEEQAEMLENAAWYRMQGYQLQKKLTAMQLSYRQAQNMLKVVSNYTTTNNPLTEKQQRWVEEQQYMAEKKLKQNGWMPQQQLKLQLELLNRQAIFYEAAAQQI